jgi:hypothetical protein
MQIKATRDVPVYRKWRTFDRDEYRPGYCIPLPNGSYNLKLHFLGERCRDSEIETYDVVAEGNVMFQRKHGYHYFVANTDVVDGEVIVEDASLDIHFDTSAGCPHVAAIEITKRN